jgi:hypothetical protein
VAASRVSRRESYVRLWRKRRIAGRIWKCRYGSDSARWNALFLRIPVIHRMITNDRNPPSGAFALRPPMRGLDPLRAFKSSP